MHRVAPMPNMASAEEQVDRLNPCCPVVSCSALWLMLPCWVSSRCLYTFNSRDPTAKKTRICCLTTSSAQTNAPSARALRWHRSHPVVVCAGASTRSFSSRTSASRVCSRTDALHTSLPRTTEPCESPIAFVHAACFAPVSILGMLLIRSWCVRCAVAVWTGSTAGRTRSWSRCNSALHKNGQKSRFESIPVYSSQVYRV